MKTAIVNLGVILTGDWREPVAAGDSIVTDGGKITHVGTAAAAQIAQCDVVIDADGATAIPGLIDSHVHITFGDYTPRQRTVGFLESYVHGGTTTCDLGVRSARAGTAEGPRGRQGARGRRHEMLRELSAGRHARLRRIGDPGAGSRGARLRRAGAARACGLPKRGSARSTRRSGTRRWSIGPSSTA